MKRKNRFLILLGAALLSISGLSMAETSPEFGTIVTDGKTVQFPEDYHSWEHVGTRLSVGGINILDGSKVEGGQFLNIYVNPVAFKEFKRSGKWPEGTVIVKEFSDILKGPNCKADLSCSTPYGHAVFQQDFDGLGMMVKDSKLFPKAPGNWGYFNFGRVPREKITVGKLMPYERCTACHVAKASDTDYVFANEHVILRNILDQHKNDK